MKPARRSLVLWLVCAASLAGNVWQAVQLRRPAPPPLDAVPTAPSADLRTPPAVEREADVASAGGSREASPAADPGEPRAVFDWRHVESEDYHTYIANLRAIGVPEQTVRDIVAADVRQSLAGYRRELLELFSPHYWEAPAEEAAVDLTALQRRLDEETADILHDLLGEDYQPPPGAPEWRAAELELRLAFLDSDRRRRVAQVLDLYAGLDAQVRQTADGRPPTRDDAQLQQLLAGYSEKRAALGQLLSPEEYEELEMRVSWTADNLRRAMARFQPTEQEFRTIFRLWREHDEQLATIYARGAPDPGNEHVFAAIREALGEERYQQYRATWWK